jgi:uncharacterized protein
MRTSWRAMKIAIIGASGFVGSYILKEALSRRHQVAALVRHPEKIQLEHENLSAIRCDVFSIAKTSQLLSACEAAISAYNPGWGNPNLYEEYMLGSRSILKAIKESTLKRVLFIGGAGSLELKPGVQIVDTPQFPAKWKMGSLASRDFLKILKNEIELEWTFISPALQLRSIKRTGTFQIGSNSPIFDENGNSEISTEDLAVATIDELENPKHVREQITVGYAMSISK